MGVFFRGIAPGLAAIVLTGGMAGAQVGPATSAGIGAQSAAAARRVMMDALQHGATHGGCNSLLPGWSKLSATVQFPASYGGYASWVNMAELLPVSDDLGAFIKSGTARGAFVRPALRSGASTVQTTMCAPAGFTYWVIVDSGMARVAVGQVAFSTAGMLYRRTFVAPPLHSSSNAPAGAAATRQRPQAPTSDNSWKPPQSDNSWSPPPS